MLSDILAYALIENSQLFSPFPSHENMGCLAQKKLETIATKPQ